MQISNLTGQVLLAMPSLQDRNFRDSVILICHHDEEGAMGLIINRAQEVSIVDVLEDLQITPDQSHMAAFPENRSLSFEGGPVDPFRGFILHDGWQIYDSTMQITPEFHLTTSRDVLEDIAAGNGPEHFMLILGYAGWAAGQLEQELANSDWLVAAANHHLLFHAEPEFRWALAARSMGIDKVNLSDQIGHA
ncbi:MAG: YqgE/AlgH family protein [Mariprofundus sp.]